MVITELEDLQVVALDDLEAIFKGVKYIQEEDVVTTASTSIINKCNEIISFFRAHPTQEEESLPGLLKNMNSILRWGTILLHLNNIECPAREELVSELDEWSDDFVQCGITASMLILNRVTQYSLNYFVDPVDTDEETADDLLDIISAVNVMSVRLGKTLQDVLIA